jgi:hypothetical protein
VQRSFHSLLTFATLGGLLTIFLKGKEEVKDEGQSRKKALWFPPKFYRHKLALTIIDSSISN